jgi:formylglycine-generating enzyme required for sulfatase activity
MRTSIQICILSLVALIIGVAAPRANAQCTGDVIPSGIIDGVDLAQTLSSWGPCTNCPADIDSDGAVTGLDLGQLLAGWGPCAPFIASVAPGQGTIVGGTPITISGAYFTGATSVTIGGAPATNIIVVSSTTITAVTPAHAAGSVSITITTPSRTSTLKNAFSYANIFVPAWATLLEATPDPAVVTDANLRAAIVASGFAWRVLAPATGIEMLLIPPGTFLMGASPGDIEAQSNESPASQVTITNAFYIGKTEVTQAQWQASMGSNPSTYQGSSDSPLRPVEQISWDTVQTFNAATAMRLPTEVEWEYACRAGTTTARYGALNDVAWYYGNWPSYGTQVVAGKLPNAFGLYDTLGNIWEWTQEWSAANSSPRETNPKAPSFATVRMLRGGGWSTDASNCRASRRIGVMSNVATHYTGFRVVRTP